MRIPLILSWILTTLLTHQFFSQASARPAHRSQPGEIKDKAWFNSLVTDASLLIEPNAAPVASNATSSANTDLEATACSTTELTVSELHTSIASPIEENVVPPISELPESSNPIPKPEPTQNCNQAISKPESITPLNSISSTYLQAQINTDIAPVETPELLESALSPLQKPPTRLINLETANQLSAGAVQLEAGFQQTTPADRPSPGTGDEVYFGAIDWGISDQLQLGGTFQFFDDPTNRPIDGVFPDLTVLSVATHAKYRIIQNERLSVAISGATEFFGLFTSLGLFSPSDLEGASELFAVGTFQVPISYSVAPQVQLHLTPGIAFYPGTVNEADFFGTFFNIGAGLSWQLSPRLNLFTTANVPLGPGDNALDSDDTATFRRVVWAVGARYALNPKVGIEIYGTNAFGATPTTSLLAFIPDGDQALIGASLNYTPDFGQNYASSFREGPAVPLSRRDTQLLLNGFTLTTASTLPPRKLRLRGGLGSGGQAGFDLAYGLDNDLQLEFILEGFGGADSLSTIEAVSTDLRYDIAAKLRLLDQVQGDPFSLSFRLSGGRETGSSPQVGTLFTELPAVYQPLPAVALFLGPKAAFFAESMRVGLGLGINYAVLGGLQLIGEVTPLLTGEQSVWSAGLRYQIPTVNLAIDVYASNAVGLNGLGGLIADSETNAGFNLNLLLP
ncbi:MAG: porin [Cyanothece sp. SIO1E1]|nr:porin [Cyanothece sp. SIO1E1]